MAADDVTQQIAAAPGCSPGLMCGEQKHTLSIPVGVGNDGNSLTPTKYDTRADQGVTEPKDVSPPGAPQPEPKKKKTRARRQQRPPLVSPYSQSDGRIFHERQTKEGIVKVPLSNFTARIVEAVTRDDGAEQSTAFVVEGTLANGTPLPRTTVSTAEFPRLDWVTAAWTGRAVVLAGQGTRDHLRCAIELLSRDRAERTVYGHTGWRQVDGHWRYLHAGGAIGGADPVVAVELPDALAHFELPAPPSGLDLAQAVRASLRFLDLGPDHITVSLLAAVFRAALVEADFAEHLAGPTGVFKSELAALCQQHFGAGMDARHLPANWSSTGNALEGLAFAAKDALLVVDDFCPSGAITDVQRYHKEADRLFRGQGNRAGRLRMKADATLRPAKPPRGLVLSTGEDVPRGQSLRARLFVIEVSKGDINITKLTAAQSDATAGLYAASMAGYLAWLAPSYAVVRAGLRQEHAALRQKALAEAAGQHARSVGIIADLALGLKHFLAFAVDAGAIDIAERDALANRCWKALLAAAKAQAGHIEAAEPCGHFLRLLAGILASGRGHVAAANGDTPDEGADAWGWRLTELSTNHGPNNRWTAQGRRIGWLDGTDLFLEPEAVYAEAQELARHQGEALSVQQKTLWRRMRERGMLASWDDARQRNTIRRTLGMRREVLHLHAERVQWDGWDGKKEGREADMQNMPV